MRFALLATTFALVTAPALAQADLKSQFDAANEIFTAGAADMQDYAQAARTRFMDGIDGTYFPIWALGATATEADYAKSCAEGPIHVTTRDPFSFAFVQTFDGGGNNTTTIFSARGGNAFGAYTDPASVAMRLGLDLPESPPAALTGVLNTLNGIATIARPSPDILVVQTNYGMPQIYARCPG